MGEVFLGEHEQIQTRVAVKLLHADISTDHEQVQRFFNEAKIVAKIKHAGLCKIFDVGFTESGNAYLIMELLEGESLASRLESRGRMSATQIADIGSQISSVLESTHRAGVVHRDLKPDNAFLVVDDELGQRERVKILDFGIAKLGNVGMTSTAITAMGSPHYMAPEQWRSASKVDWRADAYSLGCVAFEMASGRPPFQVASIVEACTAHLQEPPPSVRSLYPDVPPELDALIIRLMSKDPQHRGTSMAAIAAEFASFGNGFDPMGATVMPRRLVEQIAVPSLLASGSANPIVQFSSSSSTPTSGTSPNVQVVSSTKLDTLAPRIRVRFPKRKLSTIIAVVAAVVGLAAVIVLLHHSSDAITHNSSTATSESAAPPASPVLPTMTAAAIPSPSISEVVDARQSTVPRQRDSLQGVSSNKQAKAVDKPDKKRLLLDNPNRKTPAEIPRPVSMVTAAASTATAAPPTTGALQLDASLPCEIYVNGAASGLRTPQHGITLPTGRNRITLVNNDYSIKETFIVQIQAGKTQALFKDFSDQIAAKKNSTTINPFAGKKPSP